MLETLFTREGGIPFLPGRLSIPPGTPTSSRSSSPDAWGFAPLASTTSNASSLEVFSLDNFAPRSFPASTFATPGVPADYEGAFRTNVRAFVAEFGERDSVREGVPGVAIWTVLLTTPGGVGFELLIVEESVREARNTHCDHCRCQGWAHHPVCKRRYHFIIPRPATDSPTSSPKRSPKGPRACSTCDGFVYADEEDCSACGQNVAMSGLLEASDHVMHGVIHSNGYGHLYVINGKESGSSLLTGTESMDLWDRICAMLRARRISLEDSSKKFGCDLRLLHGVGYGETWFRKWGYVFNRGSFGITSEVYERSLATLRGLELETFGGTDDDVNKIVRKYRKASHKELKTVGDLVRFMLDSTVAVPDAVQPPTPSAKAFGRPTKRQKVSEEATTQGEEQCRWSPKRLEHVQEVVLAALLESGKEWVPRQEIRDLARQSVGDTGLLDYVLKGLGGKELGGYAFRREVNPATRVLEFGLRENRPAVEAAPPSQPQDATCRADVAKDLVRVYQNLLERYRPREGFLGGRAIEAAKRVVLDTRYFVKDYRGQETRAHGDAGRADSADDELLRLLVQVRTSDAPAHGSGHHPPPELIILPENGTVANLKMAARKAFSDTYLMMTDFHVDDVILPSFADLGDDVMLRDHVDQGAILAVMGPGIDYCCPERYEGGIEQWFVDCHCGAREDDGERMVSCDKCDVWQHTRCNRIADTERVPSTFLCSTCRGEARPRPHRVRA